MIAATLRRNSKLICANNKRVVEANGINVNPQREIRAVEARARAPTETSTQIASSDLNELASQLAGQTVSELASLSACLSPNYGQRLTILALEFAMCSCASDSNGCDNNHAPVLQLYTSSCAIEASAKRPPKTW